MALLRGRLRASEKSRRAERPWLREARDDVDRASKVDLVVDLITVNEISSDELNHLIRLHCKARHKGRKMIVANVQDQVWQVFTVTRLDRLLEIRRFDPLDPPVAESVGAPCEGMPNS